MSRYMVWVETDNSEGWGCSICDWIIATPELDTTVAALKYNRTAQLSFERHECRENGNGAKKPSSAIAYMRSPQAGCF